MIQLAEFANVYGNLLQKLLTNGSSHTDSSIALFLVCTNFDRG